MMVLWRTASTGVLVLALASALGCARQPVQASNSPSLRDSPVAAQPLPFDRGGDPKGISPTESITPHDIPAGTPITVRLQSLVSSSASHSGDSFTAVLDQPIVVDSQTLAPRGATITGKVVAAKRSGQLRDPGYLRLTLTAISINGKSLSVKTSTVFLKGRSHQTSAIRGAAAGVSEEEDAISRSGKNDVQFSFERQLTFRVTEPLPLQG